MWIDNHCHLRADHADQVADAVSNGIEHLITVGCSLEDSKECIDIAAQYETVSATVGIHPHDAAEGVGESQFEELESLLSEPGVVGVGECGLDYFYEHSPRDLQRIAFEKQIAMSHAHDLPLIIHSRDAWEDTFEILDAEGVPKRTVFHCFTGGPNELSKALDRNIKVSFSGIVTFPSAKDLQAAAVACPAESIMFETDAPYLAPVPHRGKPNRPAHVSIVGSFVADLRGETAESLAAISCSNARAFYSLPELG